MTPRERLKQTLLDLLAIPSPSGFTDEVTRYIASLLSDIGVAYDITRRGTLRAHIPGAAANCGPAQAVVCHADTIGAMVREILPSGRIRVAPIGHWSSRFAEGARVSVFSEVRAYRGTLLPCVAWGQSRDAGVETVPIGWDHIELRIDEMVTSAAAVRARGIEIGDFIALDTQAETLDNGFIVGRSLDNKAGVAAVLECIRDLIVEEVRPPRDLYFLFTVTETVGTGAGSALLPAVSELVTIDFAAEAWAEHCPFEHLTVASADAAGPYDYHLTQHIADLARDRDIPFEKRLLPAHHSDAAAALAAGHDVRTAVLAYAGDASHSLERTHVRSLENLQQLLRAYVTAQPTFCDDRSLTSIKDFSHQIDSDSLPPREREVPDPGEVLKKLQ
ncbi:MAG: osmoprotectant NAGGN system M42 family peptidase [Halieaceae bacterium]|jgi:peptidase M42 family hydrolase|nr:osmoprotectant NAGGN system M42 family peptidase [Halieaceae bacterium]